MIAPITPALWLACRMPSSVEAAEVRNDLPRPSPSARVIESLTEDLLHNKAAGSRFSRSITLADFIDEEPELLAEIVARNFAALSTDDRCLLQGRVLQFVTDCTDVVAGAEAEAQFDGSDE